MMPAPIAWSWRACVSPPPAKAAVAWGDSVRPLARRLAQVAAGDSDKAQSLAVCAGHGLLIVFGEPEALPWVDGLQYAAPSEADARLWLPTFTHPDVPHDLLARAVARQAVRQPFLLWHTPAAIVPLDRQVPLSAGWLSRFSAWLDKAA